MHEANIRSHDQNKDCACSYSQLWSPSPARSRNRSMFHLCRDTTPPALRSAWWLNVNTLCSGQEHTHVDAPESNTNIPKLHLLAEAVETLPQQDAVSTLQLHVADPALHRLGVGKQVLAVQHHQPGKVSAALLFPCLAGSGNGESTWRGHSQNVSCIKTCECSQDESNFYFQHIIYNKKWIKRKYIQHIWFTTLIFSG